MFAKLHIFQRGFSLRKTGRVSCSKGGGKRGCLDGSFSSASFRRLREFCIRFSVLDSECWGVTLTVPGLDLLSIAEFKRIHHKLVVWCNDNGLPMIWRVELQQRGMPHLHCVCYCSLRLCMRMLWRWFVMLRQFAVIEIADGDLLKVSRAFVNGSNHAVDLQRLSSGFDSFRYLVNHMSKAKQAQLGYPGRNWGVCNKELFSVDEGSIYDVTEKQYFAMLRWLRRLTRRRIFNTGCSFWVTDPAIIGMMSSFYKAHCGGEEFVYYSPPNRLHWEWSLFCLTFLSSIPQSYFDSVFDSIKNDCYKVVRELCFIFLYWRVMYCYKCFKSLDGASLSPKGRKFENLINPAGVSVSGEKPKLYDRWNINHFVFPLDVVTTSDKIEWYDQSQKRLKGEV